MWCKKHETSIRSEQLRQQQQQQQHRTMFSFPADSVWVSVRSWASVVWSWVLANNPAIIIAVLTVGIVLPVIFLAITTTVRAFRHDGDTAVNANNALPVTTSRHRVGAVDTLNGASPLPPPASAVRFELETMEEVSK